MGLLNKLMDRMRLNGEDDDYFGEDEEYDTEKPGKKGFFSDFRGDDDDYEEEEARPRFFSRSSKVVPMKQHTTEVALLKPAAVNEEFEIANKLLEGKAVVLNMEGIPTEDAQRIIDFACGAVYAVNGSLKKISTFIFIVSPESIELTDGFQDMFNDSDKNSSSVNTNMNIRL